MKKVKRSLNARGKRALGVLITVVILVAVIIFGSIIFFNVSKKDKSENEDITTSDMYQSSGLQKEDNKETASVEEEPQKKEEVVVEPTIPKEVQAKGYCNSFAGYTSAIVANGGLTTQEGSYYAQAGINVSIGIEDNDDVIIEAFKNGEIDFFYMTVNKMSLICKELEEAGIDVVIPYLSDTSTGADGIVANIQYQSIEELKDTKVAMARNSVSSAIPVWFMNASNLDEESVDSIISNFALYDSTQEAVDSFVRGECGAVSTWDMNTALKAEESHLLFSTKEAEYLVIDALVVNKEFASKNPEVVKAIIDGSIQVTNDFNAGNNTEEAYEIIRASVPDFSNYDNETMKEVLEDSAYLGYNKNVEAFDTAEGIYVDFCKIWEQLGFETDPEYVNNLFDKSFLEALAKKWENNETEVSENVVVATEEAIADKQALISKTFNLLFESNSGEFLPGYEEENYAMLDEFVKTAKVLNRMVIKIEGNVSLTPGNVSTEFDYELSRLRAQHAKEYMVEHGIEEERIIIVANGGDKPITTNDTPQGRAQNRNCILSFYTGEE